LLNAYAHVPVTKIFSASVASEVAYGGGACRVFNTLRVVFRRTYFERRFS